MTTKELFDIFLLLLFGLTCAVIGRCDGVRYSDDGWLRVMPSIERNMQTIGELHELGHCTERLMQEIDLDECKRDRTCA